MATWTSPLACAALALGLVVCAWAEDLCTSDISGEGCSVGSAQPAASKRTAVAQDNMLLQMPRSGMSKAEIKRDAGNPGTAANCSFVLQPMIPYYWDPNCAIGDVGCFADGVHTECRYCDYHHLPCPPDAWTPPPALHVCRFDPEDLNKTGFYYDPSCQAGINGCNADGIHEHCRACDPGSPSHVPCTVDQCTFPHKPPLSYYFEPLCVEGMLGCLADDIHIGCRYCGSPPYDSIPCPGVNDTPYQCVFPNPPVTPFFVDQTCVLGMLGCYADAIHVGCRWCGVGSYAGIACPP